MFEKRGAKTCDVDSRMNRKFWTKKLSFKKTIKRQFLSKRGISPLIATVLLIAFAVSIGTMIMNWGKDAIATAGDCKDVKLELQTINDKPLLCYDAINGQINVMLKNTGTVDIDSLKLQITAADFSHDEKIIDDSAIKTGEVLTKNIKYAKSGTFKVELVPIITSGGNQKPCFIDKPVSTEAIESCN
jgi:flagellin-like protein